MFLEELVKKIRIADYDYPLPDEKIARYPVEPRDASKLLLYKKGSIAEDVYRNLGDHLPKGSTLLFNQTRVVQARLKFPKNESTTIEIFCLEPAEGIDIQQAMQSSSPLDYKCLVGGARKWKSGKLEITTECGTKLSAEKIDRQNGTFSIRFSWDGDAHFAQILEEAGKTPLPPYLNRDAEESDRERYQTLFAKNNGSVAAPTAGLHFTDELLEQLRQQGIREEFLTLHVGAGTFKPVSSETVEGHDMHGEEFFITRELIANLLEALSGPIIPVGTTSMRALESLYWLGAKFLENPDQTFEVGQWEPYQHAHPPKPSEALSALQRKLEATDTEMVTARTSIIIAPGYQHRICSGLLTNFHQPKSTLLLLVASMIGEDWKSVYEYALENDFRFLSYGDGCLLLKN